jgi:hypothetical protein
VTPIYLNLASGTDCRPPPWRNLDCVKKWPIAARACDVIWDARTDRLPYSDNTVSEVYAGYLLLHLAPKHHQRVLRDIYRVMHKGARLVVGECDMRVVMKRWLENPADEYLSGLIWGEQSALSDEQKARLGAAGVAEQERLSEFDKHCQGFCESSLRAAIYAAGFTGPITRIAYHGPAVFYDLTVETFK